MSSWMKGQSVLTKIPPTELYLKVTKSGYCTNFQKFFMAFLYSKLLSKRLYLCDTASNILETFHLILDTFEPPPNVQYTSKNGFGIFEDKVIELNKYLCTLSDDFLCSEARALFRWNAATTKQIQRILAKEKLQPTFDVGIHIRTGDKITSGEMKAIPLKTYRTAIENAQKTLGKTKLSVYIMTDNSTVLPALKKLADPSWTLASIPLPVESKQGYDQRLYTSMSAKDKMESYYHFLTELHILQRCPQILCTYSSNVGRFLYMTKEPTSQIESLDVQTFTIVHDKELFLSMVNA